MTRLLLFNNMSKSLIAVSFLSCCIVLTKASFLDLTPYELIHGDLNDFEALFALPLNVSAGTSSGSTTRRGANTTFDLMEMIKADDPSNSIDINEFNRITQSLNLTRRYRYLTYGYREGFEDPQDYYQTHVTEKKKRLMLVNMNLQFLMHSRHKIIPALHRRQMFRHDKRYRLGYLFNRMRRLMTEQRKVITMARRQFYSQFPQLEDLRTTMRLYERVVRMDVDMRDTAALIKRVYGERARFDDV